MVQPVSPISFRRLTSNPLKETDTRGFSLIEMMIALLILSVSILGMTTMTLTSMRTNNDNDLRNAAIRVTTEVAEDLGALPIESVVTGTETRQVNIRGTNFPYAITRTVTSLTNDLRQVQITVDYSVRGVPKTNSAVVYKHRAS